MWIRKKERPEMTLFKAATMMCCVAMVMQASILATQPTGEEVTSTLPMIGLFGVLTMAGAFAVHAKAERLN